MAVIRRKIAKPMGSPVTPCDVMKDDERVPDAKHLQNLASFSRLPNTCPEPFSLPAKPLFIA